MTNRFFSVGMIGLAALPPTLSSLCKAKGCHFEQSEKTRVISSKARKPGSLETDEIPPYGRNDKPHFWGMGDKNEKQ